MATRPNWWAMYRKYQAFKDDPHPIAGVSAQCAVRMSMSLSVVGLFTAHRFRSVLPRGALSQGWAIRAEELYQYLRNFTVLGEASLIASSALKNKYGIVYLRDCHQRDTDRSAESRTGDHIDLVYPQADGSPAIVSAYFYPAYVSNGILHTCRDGKVRFYECPA